MTQSILPNSTPITDYLTTVGNVGFTQSTGSIDLSSIQISSLDLDSTNYKIDLTNIASATIPAISQSQYASLTGSTFINPPNSGVYIKNTGIEMDSSCDLQIGDWSLKDSMERIEERLALLQINTKLEQEWEELKSLGEQYRNLEKEIKEKIKVWNIISKD